MSVNRIKNKRILWGFLFLFIIFLIILITFEALYYDKFYPDVIIGGRLVGGKSYSEVLSYYKQKADLINENGLTLICEGKNGDKEINVKPFSTGLSADKVFQYFDINDWENNLKKAYSYGRSGSVWQRIGEQISALYGKNNFTFSYTIQEDALQSFISEDLKDFLAPTALAEFSEKSGAISITKEVIGEKIDANKIFSVFKVGLSNLDESSYYFQTQQDMPAATEKTLEPFINLAEKISFSTDLFFSYKNYKWKVSGDKLSSWITIKQDGGLGIDENKVDNFISSTIAPYINSPAVNSRFEMIDGKPMEIIAGKAGNVVDIKKAINEIEKDVFAYTDSSKKILTDSLNSQKIIFTVSLEIIEGEPKITQATIDKYDIKDLLGSATTNFKGGSLDRQHNIKVGYSKLNGILIAPGEEFSTVDAIGDVTEEEGFVKEYVINGGATVKEIGGGLCQIATTLFRSVLNAGLPITERVNHRYVISYYGPGLDATIYNPHPDLRFINNTNNYILLQARASDNEVTLEFFGKKDGRSVQISTPKLYNEVLPPPVKNIPTADLAVGKTKCTEIPHNGITADVVYTVSYANGDIKEQKFHSIYQPWQKVCLVGTQEN